MLTHSDLAAYLTDLNDDELIAFATRVATWRLLLQGTPFDATRRIVIRCLACVSEAFGDRGWNGSQDWTGRFTFSQQWQHVHSTATHMAAEREGTTPLEIQREVARWAGTVRLQVA